MSSDQAAIADGSQQDSDNESSPLLRLPAELRNNIFELTAVDTNIRLKKNGDLAIDSPLIRTSKQTRKEFLSIMATCDHTISTTATDFNLDHVLDFFIAMSDLEVDHNSRKYQAAASCTEIQVILDLPETLPKHLLDWERPPLPGMWALEGPTETGRWRELKMRILVSSCTMRCGNAYNRGSLQPLAGWDARVHRNFAASTKSVPGYTPAGELLAGLQSGPACAQCALKTPKWYD
jgi:hypothetical protein